MNTPNSIAGSSLDNIILPRRLKQVVNGHKTTCGRFQLCSDIYGRVRFPGSDWSITLETCSLSGNEVLARQNLSLVIDDLRARWYVNGDQQTPVLELPSEVCFGIVLNTIPALDRRDVICPHPRVRPRIRRAERLGDTPVRYDPIAFQHFAAHADITGAIVSQVLAAMRC